MITFERRRVWSGGQAGVGAEQGRESKPQLPLPDWFSAGADKTTWCPMAFKASLRTRRFPSAQPSSLDCIMRMPCVKGRAKAASGAAMCFNDLMATRGVANVVAADRERDRKNDRRSSP